MANIVNVLTTKLGDIRTVILDNQLLYCISDVAERIGVTHGTHLARLARNYGELVDVDVPTKMGNRKMNFMNAKVLTATLSRSQKDKANDLVNELDLQMVGVLRVVRKEEDTIMFIVMCYHPLYKMKRQYSVGRYRVDLYIHDLNIVVECDENDHAYYDIDKDAERTATIDKLLAPTWIRYNPDDSLCAVINKINHMIASYNAKLQKIACAQ